ncbi:hypothetical protein MMC30_001472 [Trapelia coarctata]|nr:hypothetical protein [Trapelia coarctata]
MADSRASPSIRKDEETIDEALKRWKAWQMRMLRIIMANNNTTATPAASTQAGASTRGTTTASSSVAAGSATEFSMLPPPLIPLPVLVGSGSRTHNPTASMPALPITVPTGPNPRRHSESSSDPVARTMGPPAKMETSFRRRLLNRMVIKLATAPAPPPRVRSPWTMEAAETMIFLATGKHPVMPSAPVPPPAPTPPPPRRNTGLIRAKKTPATMPQTDSNYLFQITILNPTYTGRSLGHQRLLSLPKRTKIADLFMLMGILFHHTDKTAWTRVHIKIDRPDAWKQYGDEKFRSGKLLCDSSKIMRGPHKTIGDLDDPDYARYVLWVVLRIHESDGVDHQGKVSYKSETEKVSHLMQLIGRATGPPGKICCLGGTGEPGKDDILPYTAEHDNDRLIQCFADGAEQFMPKNALNPPAWLTDE